MDNMWDYLHNHPHRKLFYTLSHNCHSGVLKSFSIPYDAFPHTSPHEPPNAPFA